MPAGASHDPPCNPHTSAMAKRITVVVSQSQSKNPAKRQVEEEIVAGLLGERGIDVTVVPHLYDLKPDGTGMLCLQGISGDMVVCSWLFPRAARWTLDRNGIHGHEGETLLKGLGDDDDEDEEEDDLESEAEKARVVDRRVLPKRKIYCLDLRGSNMAATYIDEIKRIAGEASTETVGLMNWIGGSPQPDQLNRYLHGTETPAKDNGSSNGNGHPSGHAAASGPIKLTSADPEVSDGSAAPNIIDEQPARRWYPVIDFSRCTNCMECIDFCLFGVYGIDGAETILVEQPDNCRKGCPACSRVCPENAIIFPQHKTPTIAGSEEKAGTLKIDLSQLFGAPDEDAVKTAVRERDEQLVLAGRDAVGTTIGIPKRQDQREAEPKDELDNLMDELDGLDL